MITIHHLENSRSLRVIWLLEELGASYQIKHYRRDAKTSLAPPELLTVHPLGKSPVITDDQHGTTTTVAETGAIVEYLVGKYDNANSGLLPATGSTEKLQYTYWLHYAEGTFMPYMVFSLIMHHIETARVPFFVKPIAKGIVKKVRGSYLAPNIKRNLEYMESHLSSHQWFCGDAMTAADIQMSFPLQAAHSRTDLTQNYPALGRFLQTIESRPAYLRAIEKGGPLKLLGSKQAES